VCPKRGLKIILGQFRRSAAGAAYSLGFIPLSWTSPGATAMNSRRIMSEYLTPQEAAE
jgi:hypothetical protein